MKGHVTVSNLASSHFVGPRTVSTSTPTLAERYRDTRNWTQSLADPLSPEDCVVQSMPDVSPTKWHLAHTTWFFETFVLSEFVKDYTVYHPQFSYLFNSYYNAVGSRHARPQRGLLSRPSLGEVIAYRQTVDEQMMAFLQELPKAHRDKIAQVVELGLQHEQQHQELLLTDIKHVLWCNPLRPAYDERRLEYAELPGQMNWTDVEAGMRRIGYAGDAFCFDNELPEHKIWLHRFQIADRLVTNQEYLQFVDAGGYKDPQFWLSDGWDLINKEQWQSPLYWEKVDGQWQEFTLAGQHPLPLASPVCHVSYYEADAYARWANARLCTEQEWECAARSFETSTQDGIYLESALFHPAADSGSHSTPDTPRHMLGNCWQWTASSYGPYPGYQPLPGALGEYNGKFMCNQFVLRGSSCVTPRRHSRLSYRNFFAPHCRWQFMGVRLAR